MRTGFVMGAVIAALFVGACTTNVMAPALPLQITLQSNRATAARGDTVEFSSSAQGGSLLGVIADFGDGATEARETSGANTAKLTFRHAYAAAGNFTVQVTVTDASAGNKSATTQIRVN